MHRRTTDVTIAVVLLAILWLLSGIVPHIVRRGPEEDISRAGAILTALPLAAVAVALLIWAVRSRWNQSGRGR